MKTTPILTCILQLVDDVTPLPHGHAKVRFIHAGGSVADQVTVKLNKTFYIDLQPFEKPRYINIISKSYHVRVAPNASSKALALVSLVFVQKVSVKQS